MRKIYFSFSCLVVVAVLSSGLAWADPEVSSGSTKKTFLEQRVADELAADGILLSRLGVRLEIEVIGSRYLVSLVDTATQLSVASTKIDSLPEDREAAVASSVPVVANLARQLAHRLKPATATTAPEQTSPPAEPATPESVAKHESSGEEASNEKASRQFSQSEPSPMGPTVTPGFRSSAALGLATPMGNFGDTELFNTSFALVGRLGKEYFFGNVGITPMFHVELVAWSDEFEEDIFFLLAHGGGEVRLAGHLGTLIPYVAGGLGLEVMANDSKYDGAQVLECT